MARHLLLLLTLLSAVVLPTTAWADIFSPYNGLEPLIRRADAIAVVKAIDTVVIYGGEEITWAEYQRRTKGEYNPYYGTRSTIEQRWRISMVRTLKGNLDNLTTTTMSLGIYGLVDAARSRPDDYHAIAHLLAIPKTEDPAALVAGQTYLVFLEQQPRDLRYASLNAEASVIPVSTAFGSMVHPSEELTPTLLRELLLRESEEYPETITGKRR